MSHESKRHSKYVKFLKFLKAYAGLKNEILVTRIDENN